jgi:hypothetical protein
MATPFKYKMGDYTKTDVASLLSLMRKSIRWKLPQY